MTSIGETLRRERLRAGLDLERVSQETKISVRMLELIEADQFDKLPGGVFARSFVRQYARLLGLDADEITEELRHSMRTEPEPETPAPVAAAPDLRMPRASQWQGFSGRSLGPNSSLPALAWVVVVMLVCSFAYTWWQKNRRGPAAPAMETTAAPAARTPETSAATSAPPINVAPEVAAAPVTPAVEDQAGTPPAAEPKPENVAAAEAPGAAATLRIALTAEEPTWVSASLNGKTVYSGTLQPKETKSLEAGATVKLVIGNAGGLEISLNGKPIPPVGPRGQVRVVQFAPDGAVQIIPKKPGAPEPL